jgi:N6-adenosine-specific RNA methylase IME4
MIKIDKEFQALIPPLTVEEYKGLEENLLTNGCLDSLKLWDEILIDGHNRHDICTKNGIEYKTEPLEFADRDAALVWIIRNQLDRRNIPLYERGRLELLQASTLEKQAKENLSKAGKETHSNQYKKEQPFQNSEKAVTPVHVIKRISQSSGISTDTLSRIKKLEAVAPEPVKAKLRTGEMSINQAYKAVKRETQKAKRKQIAAALEEPTKKIVTLETLPCKYRVVYADPPWQYGNDQTQAMPGSTRPDDHYSSMTTPDICNMPVKKIKIDNSVLFMWATTAHLQEAFSVVNAWGFDYKTHIVWDKDSHNYGPYTSVQHEILLICTHGSCTPEKSGSVPSVIRIKKTEHSKKPKEFRQIIEKMYPFGAKIELFARNTIDGWDTWGNEA